MKKLFTLVAAAFLAVSANAQTQLTLGGQAENGSWSWGWTYQATPRADLFFGSQWGEFRLATEGVVAGASYKLVVAEANEAVNLRINHTVTDDTEYITVNATEITGTFAEGVKDVELQGTEAGAALSVLSFEIDGVQTVYSQNWGVALYSGKYTTSQWGELYLIGAASDEAQTITINFNEEVPEDALQLKVCYVEADDEGKTEGYPAIPAGTTASIDIDVAVKAISLQAKDAYTIDIVSAFTAPKGTQGITNITATENVNAPMYNLAGQRVDAQFKGVVIQNGRKFMNK